MLSFLKRSIAVTLTLGLGQATFAQTVVPAQGLYFFETELPKEVTAQGGSLALSGDYHKDGKQSLRWQFDANGKLTVNTPLKLVADDPINPQTFMVWMYNPKASADNLTFQFGQGDKAGAQFQASLDFSGWRGIAVPFRDMKGKAGEGSDRLTITAPARGGELYLDQLMLNVPVDNRWPVPDRIVSITNPGVNTAVNEHWNSLLRESNRLRERYPALNFGVPLDDMGGDVAALYQRTEITLGADKPPKVDAAALDKLLKEYDAYGISQDTSGRIAGPALEFPTHLDLFKPKDVFSDEVKTYLITGGNDLRAIGKTMLQTAKFLRSPDLDAAQKADLQKRFLLSTRYVLDQGLQSGTSYQVVHHLGYQDRELFDAWFLARQLLADNKLLEPAQQSMMWFTGAGRMFTPDAEIVDANVDTLNTQLQWMIKSILLLPDPKQRGELMKSLSDWLGNTIVRSQGVAGGFKPDGSVFHHSQHYVAYALDAFAGLAPAVYILGNSPYSISKEALGRLDESLYRMWVYTKDTRIPLILSGRHPNDKYKIAPNAYKWLALSGDPEKGTAVNATLAGIFARLSDKPDFEGVAAAKDPTGAWAMNYAGMAIQRREGPETPGKSWTAIARGFSRYLVGNETYAESNLYGRYMLYGALQIIPAKSEAYDYSHDGWNWNRYPGTTSVELPFEALKANLIQLPGGGIEEMLLSTETYLGANVLGDNSMFAVKLQGAAKYAQDGFKARKSYFMFDNRIVALGSGITDTDQKNSTITTLFQHSVPKGEAIMVNGKSVSQLGTREQLSGAASLTDPAGNAYFVPAGQNVTVEYQQQTTPDDMKGTPTQGNFATAILNHGKAPKNAKYEYAIVVDAGKTPAAPGYTVLSSTDKLHAVRDSMSKGEDYAFFEAGQSEGGLVRGSSAPAMVMAAPSAGGWQISVVNPDLALYKGTEADQVDAQGKQAEVSIYSRTWLDKKSQPQTAVVTLGGKWQLSGDNKCVSVQTDGDNTRLTVTTTDAMPCTLAVKP